MDKTLAVEYKSIIILFYFRVLEELKYGIEDTSQNMSSNKREEDSNSSSLEEVKEEEDDKP